ncbi:MAG: phosphatidylglycerophosphatase A [Alphaproteobacteria bacterium]|nr:phosphatidylglycerophosphatase A [Alphaproteobacteria bacterium]
MPLAAGTVASALAVLLGALLWSWSPWALAAAVVAATFGGLWAVRIAGIEGDPGWVVIDEYAGQWIALLGLSRLTPLALLAAFLLFRFLDVSKAGPVGWAERQPGAAGVMADDVVAGGLAAGILWAAQSRWPGFLG